MNKLLCPVCESSLIDGNPQTYITWSEDVMGCENDIRRPTLQCENDECISKLVEFLILSVQRKEVIYSKETYENYINHIKVKKTISILSE